MLLVVLYERLLILILLLLLLLFVLHSFHTYRNIAKKSDKGIIKLIKPRVQTVLVTLLAVLFLHTISLLFLCVKWYELIDFTIYIALLMFVKMPSTNNFTNVHFLIYSYTHASIYYLIQHIKPHKTECS